MNLYLKIENTDQIKERCPELKVEIYLLKLVFKVIYDAYLPKKHIWFCLLMTLSYKSKSLQSEDKNK